MDEENWVLYNGGDLSKGLNGPATKVLLALNTFQGTVFENLIALHAGVCASMIPELIQELIEEGLFQPELASCEPVEEEDETFG